jgi:ankyrin repeat protein
MASEFLRCARSGDIPRLEILLKGDPELITERDTFGNTALLYAAEGCEIAAVIFLLECSGAKVSDENDAGHNVWSLLQSLYDYDTPTRFWPGKTVMLRAMVLQQAPPLDMRIRSIIRI